MKKNLNYPEIPENQKKRKNPAGIDPPVYASIQRAQVNSASTFLSLFYRPRFVYAIVALFLIIPSLLIFLIFIGKKENPVVYTPDDKILDHRSLLLEYLGEDRSPLELDLYTKDVTMVDVRITSEGVVMKWENPRDNELKEVIIEKGKKNGNGMKTLFPGNINYYIDPDYGAGDYYWIRCIDENNKPSKGVYVIPETGEKRVQK